MLTKLVFQPNSTSESITLVESDSMSWCGRDELVVTFFKNGKESERFVFGELTGRVDIYIMENGKTVDTIFFGQKITEVK